MKHTIQYGNSEIKFDLEYADRKTLRILVHPDSQVKVIAPINSSQDKIDKKVRSKASWILKQKEFFLSFHPLTPPRKYVSGETHLYLGKQYRLKVLMSKVEQVKLNKGYFIVSTADPKNTIRVQGLLTAWYNQKAEIHFQEMFQDIKPIFKQFSRDKVELKMRWMKNKWGSCNSQGQITLNTELIKATKKCIEYVLIHEMCHLGYLNHSRSFYNLLEKHLPNWRKTKYELEHFMV